MRICTFVGTRPELIKLSSVIRKIDDYFDHVLVHTGQNYDRGLKDVFFEDLGLREPDIYMGVGQGRSAMECVGEVISEGDRLLGELKPDAILIYGDTNSCLIAYPAKRRGIPIFHCEAGNRCFDFKVPEEVNRRVVDHLADVNFVLSDQARDYLLAEGRPADRTIKTGSHMPEVLRGLDEKIKQSDILQNLGLDKHEYFLCSLHREENVDEPSSLIALLGRLSAVGSEFSKEIVMPVHPRTKKQLEIGGFSLPGNFNLLDPLGIIDFMSLQRNCFCLLSDSGTVTEEASILGIPSIMIRHTHERPEGVDMGVTILAPTGHESFVSAVRLSVSNPPTPNQVYQTEADASDIIAKALFGYVDFIRARNGLA